MAHHQHALVRYVTLDRCLSRHRLTKEELIERCSAAVSDFTGDHRQLSERTFFNDLQALRDGIILGRSASIVCTEGRYAYAERGTSLFAAGHAEVDRLARRLAQMEEQALKALEHLKSHNAPAAVIAEVSALLLGEDLYGWAAGRRQKDIAEEQARIQPRRRRVAERLETDDIELKSSRKKVDGPDQEGVAHHRVWALQDSCIEQGPWMVNTVSEAMDIAWSDMCFGMGRELPARGLWARMTSRAHLWRLFRVLRNLGLR